MGKVYLYSSEYLTGPSINDVTVLGGRGHNSTMALVIESVTIGRRGSKRVKNA